MSSSTARKSSPNTDPRIRGQADRSVDEAGGLGSAMKFAALDFKTYNLGDEIQSLAARRFLPREDYFVDRDDLSAFQSQSGEPVAMILNGWYGHRPETWPPSEDIRPLLISMHLSEVRCGIGDVSAAEFFLQEPAAQYLREYGPVGARDLHTLSLLEKNGVPSYFSGCMTLTLQRTFEGPRGKDVVLNDVPDDIVAHVRRATGRNVVHTTHTDLITPAGEQRFARARELLQTYENAHCVITTRLHCFLPCLALGVPVLWLQVGQEGSRFPGLDSLVRRSTPADFISGKTVFDLEHPEPNSDEYKKLRVSLEKTATEFVTRAGREELPMKAATLSTERRYQTLLHVHADSQSRLREELATRDAELARLRAELSSKEREAERLREELSSGRQERAELADQLRGITESGSFRTTQQLKDLASRVPGVTKVARGIMGKLPRG